MRRSISGSRDSAAGNRDAFLDERPHFLRLGEGRDDPSLHLGSPDLTWVYVLLGEHERRGQIPQKRPLVRWTAAENTAFSTMTHDIVP
jgi:hypothetical protein